MKYIKILLNKAMVFLIIFSLTTPAAASDKLFYKVKKDDQLAKVMVKLKFKNVYKPKQVLEKVSKENNLKPYGDKIFPKQKIFFPHEFDSHLEKNAMILDTKEVLFLENKPVSLLKESNREVAQVEDTLEMNQEVPKEEVLKVEPKKAKPKKKAEVKKSIVEVGLRIYEGFYRLDGFEKSSGSSGTLLSEMSPSFELSMGFNWNKSLVSTLSFTKTNLSFQSLKQSSKQIENPSLNMGSISLKNSLIMDSWSLYLDLGIQENLLYKATSTTSVKILKTPMNRGGVGANVNLYKGKSFEIKADGAYYLLDSSEVEGIEVSSGREYKLGLLSSYQVNSMFKLEAGINYSNQSLDSSLVDYEFSGVNGFMGVVVGF